MSSGVLVQYKGMCDGVKGSASKNMCPRSGGVDNLSLWDNKAQAIAEALDKKGTKGHMMQNLSH